MQFQITPVVLPLLLSALITLGIAVYAWRHRGPAGVVAFALLSLAITEWSLGYALELAATELAIKVMWAKVQYVGIVSVPVIWLTFALQYTNRLKTRAGRTATLLALLPVITVVLVFTNEAHNLIWSAVALNTAGSYSILDVSHGPWFWVHFLYSYVLLLVGTGLILLTLLRSRELYREQVAALLLGVVAPWAGNALYLSGISPASWLDLTPFAFTLTSVFWAWALFRFRLFDLVPVARDTVIEHMSDGVLVLDNRNRIADVNPAARRMINVGNAKVIGQPVGQFLASWPELVERFRDVTDADTEITLAVEGIRHDYEMRLSPLTQRGRLTGRLVVLRDVTARNQALEERQQLSTLVENSSDFIGMASVDGQVSFINEAGQWLVGLENSSEARSKSMFDFIPDENLSEFKEQILPAVLQLGHLETEFQFRHFRSGATIPIQFSIFVIRHPQTGLPTAFATVSRDITERKRAEAELLAQKQVSERLAHRQATLYETLRAVGGDLQPEAVARLAVEAIARLGRWPHVAVAQSTPDRQHWVIRHDSEPTEVLGVTFPMSQGVVGRALRLSSIQYVPMVEADPDYVLGHNTTRSELALPLRRGEQLLGVLDLQSDRPNGFDEDDFSLAESLADTVALALDNARLHAETRQYLADLGVLYAISQMTNETLQLETVLARALESTVAPLGFDAGIVMLADPATGRLRAMAERQAAGLIASNELLGPLHTLCEQAFRQRQVLIVADLDQGTPPEVSALTAGGFHGYTGVPLLYQEDVLGVLCLFSRSPLPSQPVSSAILTAVGYQVAVALANARLYQKVMDGLGQLDALIQSSRDGVILIGTDRRVLVVNRPALTALRISGEPSDWVGRPIGEALNILRRLAPGVVKTTITEMQRIRRGDEPATDGEYQVGPRTLHWMNLPVVAGSLALGRLLVLRDVTEEHLLQQMRDDLTHTLVHDLRTPVTGIRMAIQLFEMTDVSALSADQRQFLNIARNSAERLLSLVNSILDISRLESGKMPLQREPTALALLVKDVLHLQTPLALQKNVHLESDVPLALPPAHVDSDLLGRVLQNLIGNAIKFTPADGWIRVNASPVADDPTRLIVSVCNTGAGLPPDLKERLFQKFVTGNQEGRGSGLGLAFCRLAVEAHGGRIWVESVPDQETVFNFTLPIAGSDNRTKL